MRQLSGQDALFLYLDSPGAHLHLGALYLYDPASAPGGRLTVEEVIAHLRGRMDVSPVFRQRLVALPLELDYPYWVDDGAFDFDAHVSRETCPAPGDWQALRGRIGELHARPLNLDRPPWEMVIVDGLRRLEGIDGDGFAILARYHHAAVDGVSGTRILDGLHDKAPQSATTRVATDWSAGQRLSVFRLLNRAAASNLRAPLRMARAAAAALPQIGRSLLGASGNPPHAASVPVTRFNNEVSAARIFNACDVDLAALRRIAGAVPGATVNDAVLAVCAGALRRYLEHHGELPEASLWAAMPMNIRSPAAEQTPGNAVTLAFVPIGTDIGDAVQRLQAIQAATDEAKHPTVSFDARQLADIAASLPAPALAVTGRLATALGLSRRARRLCNLIVTNIPGPRQTLYLGGAELVRIAGCGPIVDALGLFIAAGSYRGIMTLSVTSCPELLPDIGFFLQCLGASVAEFETAAGAFS